jgi:hypothetical protein
LIKERGAVLRGIAGSVWENMRDGASNQRGQRQDQ